MKAAAIGILWVDDEGNEQVEELSVGFTKEVGSSLISLLEVKEIVIRDVCLLDHGGTCEECVWTERNLECEERR